MITETSYYKNESRSGSSFVIADINDAERRYYLVSIPLIITNLTANTISEAIDAPGRNHAILEWISGTNVKLTASINGSTYYDISGHEPNVTQMQTHADTARPLLIYELTGPWRYFRIVGSGTNPSANISIARM
ncbi:hypothetical protein EBR57_00050 [bacterium]|nr:hypothetical protein [bacterium]